MNTSRNITGWLIAGIFCCVLQFAFASPVFAQCNPAGTEFQVNTYSVGFQGNSSVSALRRGGFVVAWQSDGQDGDSQGIYGQVLDIYGNKVGSEFRVNTYTIASQVYPSVAGLSDNGFVVTWYGYGQGDSSGVYGHVFNSYGSKVGSEFRVNTYTTGYQRHPSLAGLSGNRFVVTWDSDLQDGSGYGVYGQVFESSGKKVGSEFRVNTYTTGSQEYPSVAGLSDGRFVVAWQSDGQDGDSQGIYGQVLDIYGNKVGSEFRVNTYKTADQRRPSVASLSAGGFVVAWQSYGQDGSGYGVYGQVFESSGKKVGSEFRVNAYTAGHQIGSSVAGLLGGGFVVTWGSDAQDGSSYGVYGQVFGSSGNKIGGEFQINTYTIDYQGNSSVAGLSGNRFVVIWDSGSLNASERDVYGQRFSCVGGVSKDEMVVEFGAVNGSTSGLWLYDHEGSTPWHQLETTNPGPMTAVDIDDDGEDELVVALPDGLYTYDQINGWTLIDSAIPEAVIPFRNGIACDFGSAAGVQVWDQTGGWRVLAFADPDKMIAADTDGDGEDELIVSFSGFGLYIYDEASAWTRISSEIPSAMIRINLMN